MIREEQPCLLAEMRQRLTSRLLPVRVLRANPRELKQTYHRYRRKRANQPSIEPFEPGARFLDFVVLRI